MRQMKDSGIEWVGDIPDNWEVNKTKYNFQYKKEIAGTKCNDYDRLALTMNNVVKRSKDDNSGLQPKEFETYQIIRQNELVFKLIDLQNVSTSRVGLSPYVGLVSPAYIILRATGKVLPPYAEKYFYVLWKNQIFNSLGDDGVRSNLGKEDLLNIPMPIPPIEEQERIAEFLDKKCGEIDGLIADIKIQVQTLEQYKRSVITEAVTKGLNPSTEMKDSGAGWMPFVPAHWLVEKIKYHLRIRGQKNMGDRQVLSLYRDYGVIPKDSRDDNHNVTSEDTSTYRFVRVGDFVVNKMKAWQGSVAVSQYEGIVSPAYYVYEFTDNLFNKRYFHYLLRNKTYTTEFMRLSGGIRVGQWDLPAEAFENTVVLIPPADEQKEIADYLDNKCAQIEELISAKQSQIETLESYKKSLIYEYVTGKKEVV